MAEVSHSETGLQHFLHTFQNFILKDWLYWKESRWNKQMRKQELGAIFMLEVLSFVNLPSFQP